MEKYYIDGIIKIEKIKGNSIYHYTTKEALKGILENHELYLIV
ncbi:hypothetical protein [Peptostreptococcus equinus]|uniref:Uncharacterized protein n=1 Tax=Peptostreptococcus equinus TaxID=3003601 RepID=A0ABY7JTI4_9FIRM|nr:hypothetical protein [Peptostreptococcus sp. CBA3647]WAW15378.1 hypothetical protein O0R46_02730 [Peptostreptococcus sp. CBA3647]